jgi:putative ABC transport system permease protein
VLTLYRACLRLYPGDFRDEYARELTLVLADRLRDESSAILRVLIVLHALLGILIEAPLEHLRVLAADARYAVRLLRRETSVTLAATGMLALGIGAATLVFTLANAVLLRPLPFPSADRLMAIDEHNPADGRYTDTIAYPNFVDLRAQAGSFEQMGVYAEGKSALRHPDGNEPMWLAAVTDGFLPSFGIAPALGRFFTAEETVPNGPKVAILGYGLFERRFGADPGIVGRAIETVDGRFTIVGVMPRGFRFPDSADLWVPLGMDPNGRRSDYFLTAVGRLRPGVSVAEAHAEVAALMAQIKRAHPPNNGWSGRVQPLRSVLSESYRTAIVLLFAAASLLLAIACANVSHLLLVKASARAREMAVRTAMGATRRRLLRQLVTEGLILGAIGGGAGACLASLGLPALLALVPVQLPRWLDFSVDGRVLAFGIGLSIVTSLAFACLPALNLSRRSILNRLKEAGRATTSSPRQQRVRHALIVLELAVALTLLAGASLTARSFMAVRGQPLGYQPRDILSLSIDYPEEKYPGGAAARALADRVRAEVSTLPAVAAVGFTSGIPLNSTWGRLYTVEGRERPLEQMSFANHIVIAPGFFRTLELPIVRGRDFTDADFDARHLIVDRRFADAFFPGGDVLGRRVRFGPPAGGEPWYTIVGVAGDSRHGTLKGQTRYNLYLPYGRELSVTSLIVRGVPGASSLAADVKARLRAIDREIATDRVFTLEQLADRNAWQDRFLAVVSTSFAILALLLAAGGFYAVLAYAVSLRTHEIGVRMALGAVASDVRRMIVSQALRLAAAGMALGLCGAAAVGFVMRTQLYEVSPIDPVTFVVAPAVFLLTALASAVVPARRATQVDPLVALRHE